MRKLHLSRFLPSRLFNKNRVVWVITFFLSFSFLFMSFNPTNSLAASAKEDSAGRIYMDHLDKDGDHEGFLQNMFSGLGSFLWGYRTSSTESGTTSYNYEGGVVGTLAEIGDVFYENPSGSAIIWAQDQINLALGRQTFNVEAYNPNDTDIYYISGYTALENTIGLWNWSRNIVYAFFIIILIGVAFMILFRRSLGGQQFVTLTNSLPSIVLSLVLITFSYPISAVFIDVVSLGCNLAYNVIIAAPNAPGRALVEKQDGSDLMVVRSADREFDVTTVVNQTPTTTRVVGLGADGTTPVKYTLQPDDPQMSIWQIFMTSNAQVCGKLPLGINTVGQLELTPEQTDERCQFSKYLVPSAINGQFASIMNGILWVMNSLGVGNIIIEIALVLLIITTQFKILKRLLEDYMILSFFPILSPWIFLAAALPNRTAKTIGDYIRVLGFSALNMIIIYACFLILIVFGYSTSTETQVVGSSTPFQLGDSFSKASQLKWVPPMLGYSYGQIVSTDAIGASQNIITTIIIIVFFMAIPRIPEELQSWLSVPQLPPLIKNTGQDVASGFKQAGGYITGAVGGVSGKWFGGGKK